MSGLSLLQSLDENLSSRAQVKSIFGEPITAEGRTVIPVARIAYGFGAGAGTGGVGDRNARGEGGGGGGGVMAAPVGIVEISADGTRFIPIENHRKLAGTLLLGLAVGLLMSWRSRR